MRSPSEMDIIVVDVTNRCFLACSNCTRDVSHWSTTHEMTPDIFRTALASLKNWWKPGKVIGVIGGEPTLNKHFAEICRIFRDEFNPGVLKHGRLPIEDFNAFAHERLFDRTNGKGLWTSFGPRFTDHYDLIMQTFSHWNPNDHSQGGKHQTSLVDAKEMMQSLGIPWEEWPKLRDACWLQNSWSASITPSGKAYFCERAAQLDQLYNNGALGWDVAQEPDWWKRKPSEFGEQLSICEMCSMALPGPSQVDQLDRDIISPNHVERLKQVGSPAVKGGRYELYDSAKHQEQRRIETKDNYVAPTGIRVAQDNEYIYGKRVTCIVTCVGRAEHLKETLAHNAKLVDQLFVVTSTRDEDTASVVTMAMGQNVFQVDSIRSQFNNYAFNKGALINDALSVIKSPDWIILTDADCFLNKNLPRFLKEHALNPGCLYGTIRQEDSTEPNIVNSEPNGYFQLWNYRAFKDRWPNVMSEAFCSAGGIDSWFMQQYPKDKHVLLPGLAIRHIDHGAMGALWNGDRPGWRQCGIVTVNGVAFNEQPTSTRFKLTDTLFASSAEVTLGSIDEPFPRDILRMEGDDIVFRGLNIGHHHVHMAYWKDA